MKRTLLAILALAAGSAFAQTPQVYSRYNGQYLGNLSANRYDPNSISNPYGTYGSPYSPISVNNPYSMYGSPYSPYSATNPYAVQTPVIIAPALPIMTMPTQPTRPVSPYSYYRTR